MLGPPGPHQSPRHTILDLSCFDPKMALLDPFPHGRVPIRNFDFARVEIKNQNLKISNLPIFWTPFAPNFTQQHLANLTWFDREKIRLSTHMTFIGFSFVFETLFALWSFGIPIWIQIGKKKKDFLKKVWSKINLKTKFTLGSKKIYTGVEKKVPKLPRPQPSKTLYLSLWAHSWGKGTPFAHFHFFMLLINQSHSKLNF